MRGIHPVLAKKLVGHFGVEVCAKSAHASAFRRQRLARADLPMQNVSHSRVATTSMAGWQSAEQCRTPESDLHWMVRRGKMLMLSCVTTSMIGSSIISNCVIMMTGSSTFNAAMVDGLPLARDALPEV